MKALQIDFAYEQEPLVPTEKTEGIKFVRAIFFPGHDLAFVIGAKYLARLTKIVGQTRVIQEIDFHRKYLYLAIHFVYSKPRRAKTNKSKGG